MSNQTTFVPSAAVTISPPDTVAGTFAMPAYDAGNLDTTIANTGFSTAWFGFGARAPVPGSGDLAVAPGATILLTASAATLAASAANPLVVPIGTHTTRPNS